MHELEKVQKKTYRERERERERENAEMSKKP
jgi:hypothetical protein